MFIINLITISYRPMYCFFLFNCIRILRIRGFTRFHNFENLSARRYECWRYCDVSEWSASPWYRARLEDWGRAHTPGVQDHLPLHRGSLRKTGSTAGRKRSILWVSRVLKGLNKCVYVLKLSFIYCYYINCKEFPLKYAEYSVAACCFPSTIH